MKLIILLCLVFSGVANADSKVDNNLSCQAYSSGWQVYSHHTRNFLGNGFFYSRNDCINAITNSRGGYVCAAQYGGGIIADVVNGRQIGNGYFINFYDCLSAVSRTRHQAICAPQNGGLITYSRRFGQLGQGVWQQLNLCQRTIDEAQNRIICAPQFGGSIMMNLTNAVQISTGYWTNTEDCIQASRVVVRGEVCAPLNGAVTVANITTGEIVGGRYHSLYDCQSDLK